MDCQSCGMPMAMDSDHGGGRPDNVYCQHCTDPGGNLKSRNEVREGMIAFYMQSMGKSREEAEKEVDTHMAQMPAWQAAAPTPVPNSVPEPAPVTPVAPTAEPVVPVTPIVEPQSLPTVNIPAAPATPAMGGSLSGEQAPVEPVAGTPLSPTTPSVSGDLTQPIPSSGSDGQSNE